MRIIEETQLDFDDVLIQPKRSTLTSRSQFDVFRKFIKKNNSSAIVSSNDAKYALDCIPIMAANMGTTGTTYVALNLAKLGLMGALEKHYSIAQLEEYFNNVEQCEKYDKVPIGTYSKRIAISIGADGDLDGLKQLDEKYAIAIINIDIANGHCPLLINKVKQVRNKFPKAWIIAGTVATGDITQDLILAGADIVRVGIGSGSVCLTRLKTGVGRPQLSTIIDCADAAHQVNGYVMADGGMKNPGDVCKAFCAGADFVMSGSLFAGTDIADGKTVTLNGKQFKEYYGMSSKFAQDAFFGGMKPYRSSEGRAVYIPYTGTIGNVVNDLLGGIRSCGTYIGSHCIKHMSKHATFYKVNHQLNTIYDNCNRIKDDRYEQ